MRRILEIENLTLGYRSEHRTKTVVHNLSLTMERGECLGLIGESGAGKSTVALEVLDLLRHRGGIRLQGEALFLGKRMAYIPQDPLSALDPLFSIGHQVREVLEANGQKTDPNTIRELFEKAQLPLAQLSLKSYPHELSGGMRQRVLVALALAKDPDLIVADEPASSLDVTLQAELIRFFKQLKQQGLSFLFITHNLLLAGEFCDRIAVLYQGKLIEVQPTPILFRSPQDPYTVMLLRAVPRIDAERGEKLREIKREGRGARLFAIREVTKRFVLRKGIFRKGPSFQALSEVTLELEPGKAYGLVGESGSGKTTFARLLLKIIRPSQGEILVRGKDLERLSKDEGKEFRRGVQMVFQNPAMSLDPYWKVRDLIGEGLQGRIPERELHHRVKVVLSQVGLGAEFEDRLPGELSGGEKQRVALARALLLEPEFLILDEPTSQLDVSVQAQIVDLLGELRQRYRFGLLFITHDLALVKQVAEEIFVLYQGRVVERGATEVLFQNPQHPYTRKLLESSPKGV